MSRPARRVALELLREWEQGDTYAADLIEERVRKQVLSQNDRPLLQQLVYTVIRNRTLLDHLVKELTDGKLDPKTKRVLRLGIAEVLFMESPAHAAVNETVKLANGWAKGVVNAVLRRALAEKEEIEKRVGSLPPAIRLSIPEFLWKRWKRDFGEYDAIALGEWNQRPSPVYLRINTLRKETQALQDVSPVPSDPDYLCAHGALPKKAIQEGQVYAQDPSTALAIRMLDPQAGDRVLDACAAPGGKTFAIACRMKDQGSILAADSSPRRVERMSENLKRLGVQSSKTATINWLELNDAQREELGQFSKALVDVPCSNTGVIRRRIDVRWRLGKRDFEELAKLQFDILSSVSSAIALGGKFIYSTCSIDREENEGVVEQFLLKNPQFALISMEAVLPWRDGFDGAFAALLARES
tara:strand:- start:1568 stop:2806 length:1239 start_codon:yes stop_codon:yes gene_type:complete